MVVEAFPKGQETAVLVSGGLDSAVLVAHEARRAAVLPAYVSAGLAWEDVEQRLLQRLLPALPCAGRLLPVVRLEASVRDVYPAGHWAMAGTPPGYHTADADVYLVGRNVLLLSKAAVLCAGRGIGRIAIGPLAGNPFPDATPEFFETMGRALSLGLDREVRIDAPFAGLRKAEVIALGLSLGVPLGLTLSCMNPVDERHCGRCSKCRERREAFAEAGVADPAAGAANLSG